MEDKRYKKELFKEEDFTEKGYEEMLKVFECFKKLIDNKRMPLYKKIEDRKWVEDYIAQYKYFYGLENPCRN